MPYDRTATDRQYPLGPATKHQPTEPKRPAPDDVTWHPVGTGYMARTVGGKMEVKPKFALLSMCPYDGADQRALATMRLLIIAATWEGRRPANDI